MSNPQIVERIRQRLANETTEPTAHSVAAALRAEHQLAGSGTVLALVDQLRSETRGAGPLDALLALPGVTDVLVNGPDEVYLDRGMGLERAAVSFPDEESVRRLAQRLATQAGRRLDDASPWVDARLADGTRLHAVLAPLARPGTLVSLRVPARRSFTLTELVSAGSLSDEASECLRRVVSSRAAFIVTGGTGSGKTTLLAALLSTVDPSERLVIVEDATELRPDHPHVVGLEARPANVEGAGLVTVRDLVRQALRMRPDRLVVGEVRGAEVVDLLAALNTGHEGGCGTLHANSAADVPARFEALGVAAGLPREAVHSQLGSSLDLVIHLARGVGGVRRVEQVAVFQRSSDGLVTCVPALDLGSGAASPGPGHDRLLDILS
ncbi:TadA family conjugal transfer-associated ATPase [Aeromicrobium sp.]|uniref:TadA family conjugal transfer-associated ATPase n=1 Tax=Aeromicrobium sp. TaxID=1871063 RepID=UPI0019A61471|nr:TadA family conjugal transfer-associated ATPase [Aeromicrobium sp.]MBC7630278.1 TadA family conjugal transfer-associated ATPase [Aeromicrobium sp.]